MKKLRIQTRTSSGAVTIRTQFGYRQKWNWSKWKTRPGTFHVVELKHVREIAEQLKKDFSTFCQVRIMLGSQIMSKYV